ncbi:ATP-dependent DNA helicase [Nephila pilipes]|uniref:ATP-dependent DNA helicase n=1 Tax=Nephila pilipes TaxID=299642 RepID=A0A8X6QWS3_NEPPI|nr:ATP-dependent DNA helicase [Nephila pilipes]
MTGFPEIKKDNVLGRVYIVHPGNAECCYSRLLLHEICGPTSFKALKTVEGIVHPTFQAAIRALGLLEDDTHWDHPIKLWEKYRESLLEDIGRRMERENRNIEPVVNIVYNQYLILLDDIVTSM